MKRMMYLLLIMSFQSIWLNVQAQSWDVNTTWIFETDEYGPPIYGNYLILKATTNILINGEEYQEIHSFTKNEITGEILEVPNSFLLLQNVDRKIYYFDPNNSSKHLLYDFNLSSGESYLAYCDIEKTYFNVNIDSTALLEMNGISRKIQYVSSENISGCYFNGELIEDIGSIEYLLPRYTYVDPPPGGYLVCFGSSEFSYPDEQSCNLILNNVEIDQNTLKVYPNPTQGIINIEGINFEKWKVVDIFGEVVAFGSSSNNIMNLQHLPSGLYYLFVARNPIQKPIKLVKH